MSRQQFYAALGGRGYEYRSMRYGQGRVVVRPSVKFENVC